MKKKIKNKKIINSEYKHIIEEEIQKDSNLSVEYINPDNNKNKITEEEYNNSYNTFTIKDKNDREKNLKNNFCEIDNNNIESDNNIYIKKRFF